MAALGRQRGGLEPGGAAADDEHAARRGSALDLDQLMAGGRVDGAAEAHAVDEPAVQALVGADAGPQRIQCPVARLVRQVGVGDRRPCHADHVGVPVGKDSLADRGMRDAPRVDDRHVDRGADLARHRRPRARLVLHRLQVARRAPVVADVDVQVVGQPARRQRARHREPLREVVAALHQLVHAQPDTDGHVPPDGGTDRAQDLHQEPHPVLERPAVLVVALVRERREEELEQVVVVGVDLEAVDLGLQRLPRRPAVLLDELGDLRPRQRVRHVLVDEPAGRLRRAMRQPALDDHLHRPARARLVQRVHVALVPLDEQRVAIRAAHHGADPRRLVARDHRRAQERRTAADPRRAAAGAAHVVGDEALGVLLAAEDATDAGRMGGHVIRLRRSIVPTRIGSNSRSNISSAARRGRRRR